MWEYGSWKKDVVSLCLCTPCQQTHATPPYTTHAPSCVTHDYQMKSIQSKIKQATKIIYSHFPWIRLLQTVWITVNVGHCECQTLGVKHCECQTLDIRQCECQTLWMSNTWCQTPDIRHCKCQTFDIKHCECQTFDVKSQHIVQGLAKICQVLHATKH